MCACDPYKCIALFTYLPRSSLPAYKISTQDRTHANKPRNEHTNADTKAHANEGAHQHSDSGAK